MPKNAFGASRLSQSSKSSCAAGSTTLQVQVEPGNRKRKIDGKSRKGWSREEYGGTERREARVSSCGAGPSQFGVGGRGVGISRTAAINPCQVDANSVTAMNLERDAAETVLAGLRSTSTNPQSRASNQSKNPAAVSDCAGVTGNSEVNRLCMWGARSESGERSYSAPRPQPGRGGRCGLRLPGTRRALPAGHPVSHGHSARRPPVC